MYNHHLKIARVKQAIFSEHAINAIRLGSGGSSAGRITSPVALSLPLRKNANWSPLNMFALPRRN
jgi:hypothetical protein